MTGPEHLIAARRARADDTRHRADKALATMIRAREPITFTTVASRAGVSREYLYRVPELAAKIRDARSSTPVRISAEASEAPHSVIAALRDHIRRLEVQHATDLSHLRAENTRLRRELEAALGQILTRDAAGNRDDSARPSDDGPAHVRAGRTPSRALTVTPEGGQPSTSSPG